MGEVCPTTHITELCLHLLLCACSGPRDGNEHYLYGLGSCEGSVDHWTTFKIVGMIICATETLQMYFANV